VSRVPTPPVLARLRLDSVTARAAGTITTSIDVNVLRSRPCVA
jgi:hypothetical protein